ncbi:MAG: beta-lactamase family protein [Oscillospiraceae bacterium]|nr:beta-lactamase family protein [Oscillospiraceae bacterium]
MHENSAVGPDEPAGEPVNAVIEEPVPPAQEFDTPEPVEEEEPPPDNGWQFDAPENHGVDRDMLERFHATLANVDIRCVLIVKDGYIIDEYYAEDCDENTIFHMASVTKSVTGAVVGLAVDRGLLHVDEKLKDFFPQLNEPEQADKRDITVENLLTHTSGIYWNEWAGGDYYIRLARSENWVDFVFSQPMASEPGTAFNYTTGGSHLLGAVLQEAVGESAYDFAKEHLFNPLGMDGVLWQTDPQGITDTGNGIEMTARDAAKFGQLYLYGGNWRGQQIISEEWVEKSIRRQSAGSYGTGEHGYGWWLHSFNGYQGYYAMGHGGQYIIVIPELNLVTVMASRVSNTYTPQYLFADYVIPAFRQGK